LGNDPGRSIHEFPQGVSYSTTGIVGHRTIEIKDVAPQAAIVISHRSEIFVQLAGCARRKG
jgi:hypothetical protein